MKGFFRGGSSGDRSKKKVVESEELHEEDVWETVNPREGSDKESSPPKILKKNKEKKNKNKKSSALKIGSGGDVDSDDDMAPPHEYLARRLARTQITSHSMCEGVGRTLKGRDLRKMRDHILTKTGFIE